MLGLVSALARLSSVWLLRVYARVYVELFRGLPALLTIIIVGFALPIALDLKIPDLEIPGVATLSGAGILALGLVAGAYMSETIRAGLQAVPEGQTEAARSLGMSPTQTTVFVVIPQAFRIIVPPHGQRGHPPAEGHRPAVGAGHDHRQQGAHQVRPRRRVRATST